MSRHFNFFPTFFLLFFIQSHVIHAHDLCNDASFSSKLLKQLSRGKKGQSIEGVRELKAYFSYYGYLNHKQPHKHDNIYDEFLQLALKRYQKFFKLNITGILDQKTLTKMCQPRCNVPDFINPNTKPLPFHSHYSFFQGNPKWRSMYLTYSFDRNVRSAAQSALELALNQWESATPFKFQYTKNFSRADIKISFFSGDHGDGVPFDGLKILGHAFAPPDGRVHFNSHQVWSWTRKRNAYDIETAGLHELGHALGLDHSSLAEAVMYPVINPSEVKRLTEDDIDGIKALYNLR